MDRACYSENKGSVDDVDLLVSKGLLDLLLSLLREFEPPEIFRRSINHPGSHSWKLHPYKGFRRDIVAVIGNCAYHRKNVQDDIREKNGLLLMLQQCVTDEWNPFLREWVIWSVKNLLEGNMENQRQVAELEIQGAVDVPELARVCLRVEVDQGTCRVRLANVA